MTAVPKNSYTTFQCSSASRKFLVAVRIGRHDLDATTFQCSSASRKFLRSTGSRSSTAIRDVSVLFSEPKIPPPEQIEYALRDVDVSVLFSEPKIPLYEADGASRFSKDVSVLFSEPKIPRRLRRTYWRRGLRRFSALQRAENSSWEAHRKPEDVEETFQCSSASRKFLRAGAVDDQVRPARFSALQRAENSS